MSRHSFVTATHQEMDEQLPSTPETLDVEHCEKVKDLPSITSGWSLAGAACFMLASATFDTLATKAMNQKYLPTCQTCPSQYFEAPMFQTFTGYVGQLLFLPIYFIDQWIAQKKNRKPKLEITTSSSDFKKPHAPFWLWIFPLLLDFISTAFLNYSTMLAQASTVQMLRSSNIVLAFILSAFVLKNRIYIHQILGVLLVFVGLFLVAIYAMLYPDEKTNHTGLPWLGVLTAFAGTAIGALQWILEEFIFRRWFASPFEGVGWMGLYGVVLGAAVLFLMSATGWENVKGTFYQMSLGESDSIALILLNCGYIFSLSINTASGITVTKLASSLLRTMVNAGRTVSIWVMELILGWGGFAALNFSGLIIIIISICVYNYNYFTDKRDFWPGDRFMRKPAACLPNKFEVTNKKRGQVLSDLEKKEQSLRRRKNSTCDSIVAKSETNNNVKQTQMGDTELGALTAA